MTLYFNTAVVKEGGQPTPVEEPWFEFKMKYSQNDEQYFGFLHPVKAAKEYLKWSAIERVRVTEGAVLDSYEGEIYNLTGVFKKEGNDYELIGPNAATYYLDRQLWYKTIYHIGEEENTEEYAGYDWHGEFYGSIVQNATCGWIQLSSDYAVNSITSRSEMPDWHENTYAPAWEFDVTWNEDGSFNLTNFKLVVDAEGNVYE